MPLPTGSIQAATPYRNSPRFGCPWENATRYIQFHQEANAKYPRVPISLGVAVSIVESCSTPGLVSRDDGYGDGPALGIMQVKRLWQYLEPDADVMTARGGILLGYAVLDHHIKQLGTWQAAIRAYHPGVDPHSGATPDSYVRSAGDLMAEFETAVGDKPQTGTYNWSVPDWPSQVTKKIVPKPAHTGAGFDRVPFRGPNMIGTCDHITDGGGTKDFIFQFFSTGGERAWDALTDSVIDRDGTAYILNDPWTENEGGTRAGWANGGSNGLEGDGVDFVRKLGVSAINNRLFSKEHIARTGQTLTDKQVETSIAMSVIAHQRAHTKWDQFPFNDVAGCVTAMVHFEFATKACPGDVFMAQHQRQIWAGTKAGLKELQTGVGGPVSPPDPLPPPDPLELPFDLTWDQVAWMFGTLQRKMPDGTIRGYPADPTGIITNAWLGRAAKDGVFPRAGVWEQIGNKHFVQFQNGWVLYAPAQNDHINFRWVDLADLEAERRIA